MARRAALTIACVASSTLLLAQSAARAGSSTTSPKDTFSLRISQATGKFSGDHGRITIYVSAPQSSTTTRQLTLTFVGHRCRSASHCLDLRGRPTGTITQQPANPDVGRTFAITAAGAVKPLGHVAVSGTAHGVGFISKGHEQMKLSLTTSKGTVTLVGSSGTVPGFSSP